MTPMVTYVAAGGRAAAPALARRTDDAGYHRLVGVGVATTALSHALGGARWRRSDDRGGRGGRGEGVELGKEGRSVFGLSA